VSLTEEEEEEDNYKNKDDFRVAAEKMRQTGPYPRRAHSHGYASDLDSQRQRGQRSPLRTYSAIFVGENAVPPPLENANYALAPAIANSGIGFYPGKTYLRRLSRSSIELRTAAAADDYQGKDPGGQNSADEQDSVASKDDIVLNGDPAMRINSAAFQDGRRRSLSTTQRLASQDPAVILLMRSALLADQELDTSGGGGAEISPNEHREGGGLDKAVGEIGSGRRLARAEAVEEDHEVIN
jgi:hypothetical protein